MEWLHPGCHSDLSADFLNFGVSNFPFKHHFKKCFKIVFFLLWRRDPVLELQFATPLRVVLLCFVVLKFELRSDDMKIAKKNVADIWEDMKPDEKSSDVKCEGCNVMCEESACFTLHCTGDARRSCSWTTTWQQLRTKHARTGLAGALRMQVPL